MKCLPVISVFFLQLLFVSSVFAQSECADGQSVSAAQILDTTASLCCRLTGQSQNRCFQRATSALRKVKTVIGPSVSTASRDALIALREASCDADQVTNPPCTAETSTTTTEAVEKIEEKACNLKFQSSRVTRLRKLRRSVSTAAKFMGRDYSSNLKLDIRSLIDSPQCGQGGEENTTGCDRIVNPRDGLNGNVWKQGDHGGVVFVTHDGTRSGTAIELDGDHIGQLSYTGTANPDQRGPRHHYRLYTSCSSLPSRFYLKLGSTCYEIDDRCGRID